MGDIISLFEKLTSIEHLISAPKWKKMAHHPTRYIGAQIFRRGLYPIFGKGRMVTADTFFGTFMKLQLPAAMDIYLWGCKTHDSELRLSKFLILNLQDGDEFMDIGVHFGFFSLLAAKLTGEKGRVTSIEASPEMFAIFNENTRNIPTIQPLNIAASSTEGSIDFYEFPILYSEYNTLFPDQYKDEDWYRQKRAKKVTVKAVPPDTLISQKNLHPKIIKIDVEGAELDVLRGLQQQMKDQSPIIVMEYLNKKNHQQAIKLANSWGYSTHLIDEKGGLNPVDSLPDLWAKTEIDSDNIVLKR